MAPLTQDRRRFQRTGQRLSMPVKALSVILHGGIVLSLAGVAVAARAATTRDELTSMMVLGVATGAVTGGAVDGAAVVDIDRGPHAFGNSGGGDALTRADI